MKWLTILVFISLLSFVLYSGKVPYFQFNEQKPSGIVLSTQGVVMGLSQDEKTFKNIKANTPLYHSSKIKTGFDSSSLIEFGETFKISSDSSVELIKRGRRYEVHLISGEIQRDRMNRKTEFFINNKKINIKNIRYRKEDPSKNQKNENSSSIHTIQEKEVPLSSLQLSLKKTFKLHQRFLEKCFIKHYERSQGETQSGTVLVEFNIERKGSLKSILIKKSDYTDESFHSCIIEVISRIQMKRQEFEVLKVEFPIQVSLPNELNL